MQALYGTDITLEELKEEVELDREALTEEFVEDALDTYAEKEKEIGAELMRDVERYVILQVVDTRWRAHLDSMDYLRDGIHLRAMAQKDPLVEYRAEGHLMFEELSRTIREEVVLTLFHVQIEAGPADRGHRDGSAGTARAARPERQPPVRARDDRGRRRRSPRRGPARVAATALAPPPRARPAAGHGREHRAPERRPQRPVLVRLGQEVQEVPRRVAEPMSETAIPLDQQLEEIRAQLAWVRDYL